MNDDIRQKIKEAGLYQCQVARKLGIYEHDLYRMLSKRPLSEERRVEILNAITELTGGGKQNDRW